MKIILVFVVIVAAIAFIAESLVLQPRTRRITVPGNVKTASVFTQRGQEPFPNESAAELLRYVTAYGSGMESLVDVTPFSPLLENAADGNGDINFYAFIDTWVTNGSGTHILYMNNISHQCFLRNFSYGNGWSLTLDLLLWPQLESVDTRPRHSAMLGNGPFGGRFPIGVVTMLTGNTSSDGKSVDLNDAVDLAAVVADPPVYACEADGEDARLAAFFGHVAQQAEATKKSNRNKTIEEQNQALRELVSNVEETLASSYFHETEFISTADDNLTVTVSYNSSVANVQPGLPVYFGSQQIVTDQELEKGLWWNLSFPFKHVGRVLDVDAKNGTCRLLLDYPCAPNKHSANLPKLLVPVGPSLLPEVRSLVETLVNHSERWTQHRQNADLDPVEPLLLQPSDGWSRWRQVTRLHNNTGRHEADTQEFVQPPLLGRVVRSIASSTIGTAATAIRSDSVSLFSSYSGQVAGRSACVVFQRNQGKVLTRTFSLPYLRSGDKTVLQLAVTGHGWASTTESCGEFCHAVYRLTLNGHSMANITQWRDDCELNPVNGLRQRGTWWEHRNGWCPGAVAPGFFLDVTQWAKADRNELTLSVVVWSSESERYEPYSDFSGFVFGDQAQLIVGFSFFIYSQEAVAAITAQERAYTAAEVALRQGSSAPDALKEANLAPRRLDSHLSLKQAETSAVTVSKKNKRPFRVDIEKNSPWYSYNESARGVQGFGYSVSRYRLFDHVLIQASSRTVRTTIKRSALPQIWGQAALLLKLEGPEGLETDHWDRLASVGLTLRPGKQHATVVVEEPHVLHEHLNFQST